MVDADSEIDKAVKRARSLAWSGDDEAAKAAFIEALRLDPTHFEALNDLGALASASGHRSAARTSYRQAVRCHPSHPIGRVNLGNILVEDGELAEAREHYEAALDVDPDLPEAHQGLARVFAALGDERAEAHFRTGFAGRAIMRLGYRGVGPAVPALLLASMRLGNMPTRQWLDDRLFAVTVVHVEYWDDAEPLPAHALIVNIVGDADLCGEALERAETLIARSAAPVVNPPALVRATSRAENVRRLGAISGVIAPATVTWKRADIIRAEGLRFPLLLRTPGFHTGQNFVLVETRETLAAALDSLPGDELMAIEFLDARGPDGMARKYRVMFIAGKTFPLHLAISHSWKVHYFTSAMAENAAHREEERRFLENTPDVLGERAMAALDEIRSEVGLDYFGIDFALAPDGRLLLFEANAAMVVIAPPPEPIWDYRRGPVAAILAAAKRMALTRALAGGGEK
jgi:glutathione synthase/RimK-type ligase-like ATP-grasp enzyme